MNNEIKSFYNQVLVMVNEVTGVTDVFGSNKEESVDARAILIYALSSKGELFDSEDMHILVNLLTVIDNPRADIPLCHLLCAKSPTHEPEMTLEETVVIRRAADGAKSLYDAIVSYAETGNDKTEEIVA